MTTAYLKSMRTLLIAGPPCYIYTAHWIFNDISYFILEIFIFSTLHQFGYNLININKLFLEPDHKWLIRFSLVSFFLAQIHLFLFRCVLIFFLLRFPLLCLLVSLFVIFFSSFCGGNKLSTGAGS